MADIEDFFDYFCPQLSTDLLDRAIRRTRTPPFAAIDHIEHGVVDEEHH